MWLQTHGASRAWISDLFPYTAKVVDDICIVRSMFTEAINHDRHEPLFRPEQSKVTDRLWAPGLAMDLSAKTKNLPAFTVLLSRAIGNGQGVYSRLWFSISDLIIRGVQAPAMVKTGFIHQDLKGMDRQTRRKMLYNVLLLTSCLMEWSGSGNRHKNPGILKWPTARTQLCRSHGSITRTK